MAGARDDVLMPVAEPLGSLAHGRHARRVEGNGLEAQDLLDLEPEPRLARDRVEDGTLSFHETHALAQGVRHHQNIREQNGGIEAVPADRLQRHLGSQLGIIAEVEKRACLPADCSVLGKIPSGLPHEPHGRHSGGFALKGT